MCCDDVCRITMIWTESLDALAQQLNAAHHSHSGADPSVETTCVDACYCTVYSLLHLAARHQYIEWLSDYYSSSGHIKVGC
jgi:hypothetical protein